MQRWFSSDLPFHRFAWHTLVVSIAAILPLLALYVALTPDLARHLAGGGPALTRFVRQVLTNGVPVVFAINYVAFFLYAAVTANGALRQRRVCILVLDASARIVAFVVLHGLVYVLSADWFGSFGGIRATAVRVVAPTLARSAFFENISGVYLYATLVGALPLHVSVIEDWLAQGRSFAHRRSRGVAVLLSLVFFGAVVALLTGIAGLLSALQSSS